MIQWMATPKNIQAAQIGLDFFLKRPQSRIDGEGQLDLGRDGVEYNQNRMCKILKELT